MGATATEPAEVVRQRADVGAFRALNLDRVHQRIIGGGNFEAGDRDRTSLALDLDTLARQLVKALAVNLQGTDHRRDLHDVACEVAGHHLLHERRRERTHVKRPDDLAGRIERVGTGAEHDLAGVGLAEIGEEPQQACGLTDTDQQHPGGIGIECAGVADLTFAEAAAQHRDYIVAGDTSGLVDHGQPMGVGGLTTRHQSSGSASASGSASGDGGRSGSVAPSFRMRSMRSAARIESSALNDRIGVFFERNWRATDP